VLSIYDGFFAGGARELHTTVVRELHRAGGQQHCVLSLHRAVLRESLLQTIRSDSRCRSLRAAGVRVSTLGRPAHGSDPTQFNESEIVAATRHVRRADVVLSLKEQPMHLLNQLDVPTRPVVVCLHRSDPENQGLALTALLAAISAGRVAAVVCCAESTRASYLRAGIPAHLLTVIPNGVDLARFRPAAPHTRRAVRHELGVPAADDLVVFAARHDGMKNVPLFLAAARDFLARGRNRRVVMCGAGMSVANGVLRGQIDDAFGDRPDLLHRLRTLGVRKDMPSIYAAADVVALTSSSGEAAPLCLIEGMMCGAIPVATDVGDCTRIVDGRGLICEPDPAATSAAWAEAIARRSQWAPAIQRSRPQFSHTRMTALYAAIIDKVAGGRPRTRRLSRTTTTVR
jgi:glycosyltransferase involved in cell wall biosynthesis